MGYISIKNDEKKNYELIRKADLNLRAKYPELKTYITLVHSGFFKNY